MCASHPCIRSQPRSRQAFPRFFAGVCGWVVCAKTWQLVQQGAAMIRQRQAADLDAWLQTCQASPSVELQNFVDVLQRDYAAVKAALTLPWSNGPVEGHINRLKLIKRSGYGRMQLDLLRQRVLYDAA